MRHNLNPVSTKDVELANLRDGYPALAAWMACDSDDETLIFRRFSNLSARNILHLQAQIIALEQDILDSDEIARLDAGTLGSSMRWETMMQKSDDSKDPKAPARKRVQELDRLKYLLRDYYEALLQRSYIARLERPNGRTLATVRDYVERPNALGQSAMESVIEGRAKAYLDSDLDLVALTKPIEEDYLSQALHGCWKSLKSRQTNQLDRTMVYKSSNVSLVVTALNFLLAAILLVGAIVHLYTVGDPKAKLGFVVMYTLLFASSVAFCTNARRVEVFAATAAYAAVLVVFVSGELGRPSSQQCFIQLESGIFRMFDCPGSR